MPAISGRFSDYSTTSQFGFTPILNKSWQIKREGSFFKTYFVEADVPVRFNRPPGGPSTNPVTFAIHFGLGFDSHLGTCCPLFGTRLSLPSGAGRAAT
jgi:hypothetical protein